MGNQINRWQFIVLGGAATGGLVAAACIRQAQAPATTPGKAKERIRWRHAVTVRQISTAFQFMGMEKGFFDEEGIDIEMPELEDGATLTRGVIAGDYDSGSAGPSPVFAAIAEGASLKMIGTDLARVSMYLYGTEDITSLEDLCGREVGVASLGAFLHALASAALAREGLDPDCPTWVNIGGSTAVWQALVTRQVEAGVSRVDFLRELPDHPHLHAPLSFADLLPDYLHNCTFTTEQHLTERRDDLVRVMTAYIRGIRYALDNKSEFVALAQELTGADEETISWTFDQFVEIQHVEPNFRLDEDQTNFTQQVAVDTGHQREVLPFDQVATDEIQAAIIAELGEYRAQARSK